MLGARPGSATAHVSVASDSTCTAASSTMSRLLVALSPSCVPSSRVDCAASDEVDDKEAVMTRSCSVARVRVPAACVCLLVARLLSRRQSNSSDGEAVVDSCEGGVVFGAVAAAAVVRVPTYYTMVRVRDDDCR